jgi:hypothetical protein
LSYAVIWNEMKNQDVLRRLPVKVFLIGSNSRSGGGISETWFLVKASPVRS